MQVNRECYPTTYDAFFNMGKKAAEKGQPRIATTFEYAYEGGAWLDGYDSVKVQSQQVTRKDIFDCFGI